jgi:polysaccharide export outer membrane protein
LAVAILGCAIAGPWMCAAQVSATDTAAGSQSSPSVLTAQQMADRQTAEQQQMRGAAFFGDGADLQIGPGDLLEVQVFNTPELSGRVRVDEQGDVHLPVAGKLAVSGETPGAAAAAIETLLKTKGIMLDPHVSVFVQEYATQGVTVLGEVKMPGTYSLLGPHTLSDALAAAGGPLPTEGPTITITRVSDREHPVTIDVNQPDHQSILQSTIVSPGDTVVVSKAAMIYVVGDVARPGAYYVQNGQPVTVLSALAFASGLNPTASGKKASIIRPTADGALTIPIDLDKVMENKTVNVRLQASDVLVIPRSGVKVFLQYAVPGATSAVAGAAASALVIR